MSMEPAGRGTIEGGVRPAHPARDEAHQRTSGSIPSKQQLGRGLGWAGDWLGTVCGLGDCLESLGWSLPWVGLWQPIISG